jgi:AraC family transcriptional regulator of adaptative response/methylated-DNA-[protein]-cysteine methyltransferase
LEFGEDVRRMKIMKTSLGVARGRKRDRCDTDEKRWKAVVSRDPGADGRFLYAVKTTGVYCRPSCPSRLARRGNVFFFDTCEAAERAGFRACHRCCPKGPAMEDRRAAVVAAACRVIETGEGSPDLSTLAARAGMSRFHFHRIFTRITGLTPKAYAGASRAERMRRILPLRSTVTEAIYDAGFNSSGRFYAASSKTVGMKPRSFRQGGIGEVIRFAVGRCAFGSILVAATGKGVCAISLGDDPEPLEQELQVVFPRARLIRGDKNFAGMISKVIQFVEEPHAGIDLPLDVRGTAFQRRVWDVLRKVRPGSTASYAEVARRIGAPKAARAVASACASNKMAVAIPCHRIVRADGGLSGYRWGVERKRALLAREKSDETKREE